MTTAPPPNETSRDETPEAVTYVVGVGASAGGLEALEQMFRRVPDDTGMAFVVVQHLSPDFKSQMDELLTRWTSLPVHVVEHEMRLRPDAVYLIPPNVELIVSGQRLLLKERSKGLPLPIDLFLRSLASDAGDRAIAVVLSGTGSDGSRGIRDVHEAGGLVVVQSEETAKFDGMPRSAIDTGVVDLVLPPGDIGAALVRHARARSGEASSSDDPAEAVKEGGMRAVFALLRERYGIDFSAYKPGTIGRRTERRILLGRAEDLSDYIERLRTDRAELDTLYHDLLIGVTQFFRDPDSFLALEREVLPGLVDEVGRGQELRVWVAGCATGEEAYSLAILLTEAIERADRPVAVKVFATDVHRPSLDHASAGIYSEAALAAVTSARRTRFFVREDQGFRVSAELRRMIVFAPHNVIRDAPFTKLDLVSCRNMLIYFQPAVQRKVLSLFHFGLRTGGAMFLGPSESPGDVSDEFETVDQHWRIYRKRRDVRLLPGLRTTPLVQPPAPARSSGPRGAGDGPMLELFGALLDRALPPSVLIDNRRQIVHSFGDVSPLLRLPRGRPSLGLLDMLDGELELAVAGALHRAGRSREPVSFTGVRTSTSLGERRLDVRVTPIEVPRLSDPFYLVSLEGTSDPEPRAESAEPLDLDAVSRDQLEALELELRHSKENLQATIEELEASNEELQATNEELLASNEELQSTNEELHSVNEELYTVNAEYQRKIDQLVELTDDMDNLLLSTEVHTLFLDGNLCIRKFTPAVAETFNLVESDVGRRIDGFVHGLVLDRLGEVLEHTLETGERFEQEVASRTGTVYLMRVVPYRGSGHHTGVVLTLIDITKLREVEVALREQVQSRDRFLAMLSHELRNPLAAVNNALTLLERRAADRPELRDAMTNIGRQSRHMQRLLDDLLDVARVTQGKIRLREETFDLRDVARDVIEQIRPITSQHRHAFAVELDQAPVWIRGDRARVLQVMDNLLTNAIKYTPEGGHLALRVARERDHARVIVTDDGVGIDPATRSRIFEMFVQADATLDRSQGGLGVGLTLVHHIVGLHHGEIEVHSDGPGKGSTFVVTLPLEAAPAEVAASVEPAAEGGQGGAIKLVVVEDRLEIRETLAELLRDDGFEVVTADNGTDGLELVAHERPGAALLDIGLPGLDGFQLARRLRADPATAGIRLVALTGYGSDEDKLKVKDAGFDAHIIKPFHIDEVLATLGRLGVAPPVRLRLPPS